MRTGLIIFNYVWIDPLFDSYLPGFIKESI
jgi:hypothetical protein